MKRITRPVIGVSGPDRRGGAWFFTRFAVWLGGGRARRITPSNPVLAAELDGLIVGGGADVAPELYGEAGPSMGDLVSGVRRSLSLPVPFWSTLVLVPFVFILRKVLGRGGPHPAGDTARDRLEYELIEGALKKDIPVLGICRGAQLLNVYLGGTLYRDLSNFYVEHPRIHSILPEKRIEIEPDSRLARILNTAACKVNGLHQQAIKEPGRDLRVAAREASGVIQAVEHRVRPFVLGVQWHPEYLFQTKRQRVLFERLILAAKLK